MMHMNILLSNDDGINAPTLKTTAVCLARLGEVYVVAPEFEQSSTGHGLTMHAPIRARETELPGSKRAWAVEGRPADCVKLALEKLLPFRPELVVAGINPSANLGTEIIYSGTVAAAMEGYLYGLPAISISAVERDAHIADAAECLLDIIRRWRAASFQPHSLLNVNYPACSRAAIQGYRLTKQGWRWYIDPFAKMKDPKGREFYWLHGSNLADNSDEPDSDLAAIRKGYVSITPMTFDTTDYQGLAMWTNSPVFL